MARLPAMIRGRSETRTAERSKSADDPPGLGSALRKALLGLGILALAYVVARLLGSGSSTPGSNEVREPASVAPRGTRPGSSAGRGPGLSAGRGPGAESTAELPGVERSDEEIAERAESDIQAEPAEPGEMTVDEEVVEDIVEEAETEEAEAEEEAESGADDGSEPGEDEDRE